MSNNLKHSIINNLYDKINNLEQQLKAATCTNCSNGITIPVTSIKEEAIVENFLEIYKKQDFKKLEEAFNVFKL
tara:strand:+ start:138 stop:359 length:222 start_codon:yes stop_codon:yes gene_type:complete